MPASKREQEVVAARRARVLAMRASGATFGQIADAEGLAGPAAAAMDVKRALVARGVDLERVAGLEVTLELERLDMLERTTQSIMRAAMTAGGAYDPKLALRAVDRLTRISLSRRKLLGLDQSGQADGERGQAGFIDEIAAKRERRRRAQGW